MYGYIFVCRTFYMCIYCYNSFGAIYTLSIQGFTALSSDEHYYNTFSRTVRKNTEAAWHLRLETMAPFNRNFSEMGQALSLYKLGKKNKNKPSSPLALDPACMHCSRSLHTSTSLRCPPSLSPLTSATLSPSRPSASFALPIDVYRNCCNIIAQIRTNGYMNQ